MYSEESVNINIDGVSILPKRKQSGNENNENKDFQVNTYDKNEADNSTEGKTSE